MIYIYNILVLRKYRFSKHIFKIKIISAKLLTGGLKVSANKYSFWLKYIPYLGCTISWERVKYDMGTVQMIMDLRQSTTMTEVRVLISMSQYYRDIWKRRLHVLDPLTGETIIPKSRKSLWNIELEV